MDNGVAAHVDSRASAHLHFLRPLRWRRSGGAPAKRPASAASKCGSTVSTSNLATPRTTLPLSQRRAHAQGHTAGLQQFPAPPRQLRRPPRNPCPPTQRPLPGRAQPRSVAILAGREFSPAQPLIIQGQHPPRYMYAPKKTASGPPELNSFKRLSPAIA